MPADRKAEPVTLVRAEDSDINWIVAQELRDDFAAYIHRWPAEAHRQNLADPDYLYLIARDGAGRNQGYIILRGLASPARSLELKRIVAAEPSRGLGRAMLQAVIDRAFGELTEQLVDLRGLQIELLADPAARLVDHVPAIVTQEHARHPVRALGHLRERQIGIVALAEAAQDAAVVHRHFELDGQLPGAR